MNYFEMREAVKDAEETIENSNRQMASLADLLQGRLRIVSNAYNGDDLLANLKRELSQFNAKTGTWKN